MCLFVGEISLGVQLLVIILQEEELWDILLKIRVKNCNSSLGWEFPWSKPTGAEQQLCGCDTD